MQQRNLDGKRIAILATDGVEQVELLQPRQALQQAGAQTELVSPKSDQIRAWNFTEWGDYIPVDKGIDMASPNDYDALLLPGGVMNPDFLRMDERAVRFTRTFFDQGKPVASICHGPWMVVEADAARGRQVTSWPSLKTDLKNAGATWVDREVVVDNGLVTSRKPDDIPAFNEKMIAEFAAGVHAMA